MDQRLKHTSNRFVSRLILKGRKVVSSNEIIDGLTIDSYVSATTSPRQAKQAFVFASIEQLVPVLSDKCIRDWVWGVCYP